MALYIAKPQSLNPGELGIFGDVALYNNDGEYVSLIVVRESCASPELAASFALSQLKDWEGSDDQVGPLQDAIRHAEGSLSSTLERIDFARALGYQDIVEDAIAKLDEALTMLQDTLPA